MKKLTFVMLFTLDCLTAHAQGLYGFADMHTHPMSHLGFGGVVMYGAPDEQSPMPPGQKYRGFDLFNKECNDSAPEPAGSIEGALGFCNAIHGGPGFGTQSFGDANDCGDFIRQAVIGELEEVYQLESNTGLIADHEHHGYPNFAAWPHWSSISHQQMWWQWIDRARSSGLRVMVALAVNNSLLAKAANGNYKADDKASIEYQLTEIARFVARHNTVMEVAKTPADLRRIVRDNRIAVVLGVESEDIGNFAMRAKAGERISTEEVQAELQDLFERLHVRYVLPVHFSNNVFGGPSIARELLMLSSRYYTDQYVETLAECGSESLRTGLRFMPESEGFGSLEAEALRTRDLGWVIDHQPSYERPSSARPSDICGMRNARGLQPLGTTALRHMMQLGMMIDIDHMSRRMVNDVLTLAERPELNYPVSSGHNGLADPRCFRNEHFEDDSHICNEHARTLTDYQRLHRLGGMIGVGHGGSPRGFSEGYHSLLEAVGGRGVAIGTDVNGLFPMPGPSPVVYDSSFPRYWFGRAWDYSRDGFAHYGMFPDFIRAATDLTRADVDAFMSSAEDFARMWEKSEERARAIRAAAAEQTIVISPQATGGFCPYGLVRGDAEYSGHGPRVTGSIALEVTAQRDGLQANVSLRLTETTADWSEVRAQLERVVYRAPVGTRIVRIESPAVTNVDFTLSGGGRNEIFQGCDGDEHNITLRAGGPAKTIRLVGDTGGADVSNDSNCNCDTRISDITWRPIRIRTTR